MLVIGHYYSRSYDGDEYHLDRLVRTRKEAREAMADMKRAGELEYKERVFIRPQKVEFSAGDRFVAVCADWWVRDWLPEHSLDVPQPLRIYSEGWSFVDAYQSREEAFRYAAAENEEESDCYSQEKKFSGYVWYVVVQIGEPFRKNLWNVDITGETGIETVSVERPVRLVRPTAEEVERYASERYTWREREPAAEVG
jgi:hypothetical protein